MPIHHLAACALLLLLTACSSQPSRYQHKHDFTPQPLQSLEGLVEPTPQVEPRSVMGNPASYVVFGKRYHVLPSAQNYKERGEASWYGMKFHGHQTSNGEVYDVYQFTAAHKTLPLPSYAKVTRLDTGESVVVRINDRGPFHPGRIIDLSYAAAKKLGIDKQGVAAVEVETLIPEHRPPERWVQVGAFSSFDSANRLQTRLSEHFAGFDYPIHIVRSDSLNRVRIGPVPEGEPLEQVLQQLQKLHLDAPVLLGAHQL